MCMCRNIAVDLLTHIPKSKGNLMLEPGLALNEMRRWEEAYSEME